VSAQVLDQFAVSQAPDLHEFVPSTRDDDRVRVAGREFDAAWPEGVVLFGDGELAFSQGVPQADGPVPRGRNDLSVVGGEGDAEDFFRVTLESSGGGPRLEIPQTEGVIPRSGESKKSIRRDDHVLHEVRVTAQRFARITVVSVFVSQIPDKNSFVS